MSSTTDTQTRKDARARKLAEQLRANLARRKQQSRARRDGGPDRRPDGLEPRIREPDTGAGDAGVEDSGGD